MDWEHWLTIAAVVTELSGALYYLWTIPKGTTRPQPISWAGWTAIGAVGAWGARDGGAGLSFYIALSFVAVTAAVFVASLIPGYGHKGTDKPRPIDIPILLGGVILLILQAFGVFAPAVHVSLAIIGDACFAWFTLRKAWLYPETENLTAWLLATIAAFIGVMVLSSLSYSAAAFPMYLFVGDMAITLAITSELFFPAAKRRLITWARG